MMRLFSILSVALVMLGCAGTEPQVEREAKGRQLYALVTEGRLQEAKALISVMTPEDMTEYWAMRLAKADLEDMRWGRTDEALGTYEEFMQFYQAWLEHAEEANKQEGPTRQIQRTR